MKIISFLPAPGTPLAFTFNRKGQEVKVFVPPSVWSVELHALIVHALSMKGNMWFSFSLDIQTANEEVSDFRITRVSNTLVLEALFTSRDDAAIVAIYPMG